MCIPGCSKILVISIYLWRKVLRHEDRYRAVKRTKWAPLEKMGEEEFEEGRSSAWQKRLTAHWLRLCELAPLKVWANSRRIWLIDRPHIEKCILQIPLPAKLCTNALGHSTVIRSVGTRCSSVDDVRTSFNVHNWGIGNCNKILIALRTGV